MSKKKPRIYIGINEVGDYTLNITRGFRALGYQVTNAVLATDSPIHRFRERHDRYIRRGAGAFTTLLHRFLEFGRVAPFHDIFIFLFSESFSPSSLLASKNRLARWLAYRDLAVLRAMGKKIVIVTNGCDVMHHSIIGREAKKDGFEYYVCLECDAKEDCSLPLKTEKIDRIDSYADYIFSTPLMAVPFKKKSITFSLPVNISATKYSFTATDNPLVLHAPTNKSIKGTKYIVEAAERLKKEGHSFRFLLCENMTNAMVRQKLEESEVVADQILARGHGLFALEALASGNVVLNHAVPGRYGYPSDQPFIVTTPKTIYDNLKMVLENPELRKEKAKEGRAYVEKYHDHVAIARKFLEKIGEHPPD